MSRPNAVCRLTGRVCGEVRQDPITRFFFPAFLVFQIPQQTQLIQNLLAVLLGHFVV
jgi:hypothetical protein